MLVTIVTPSLNGIRYLEGCISSVEAQRSSTVDVEHIFVDGGSQDGTPEYAAARGCKVLTREEPNLYVAFNKGFRHASGGLIGILGCDDILYPGALDIVVRRYARDGKPWLMGASQWLDAAGRARGTQPAPPAQLHPKFLASIHWSPFTSLATYMEPELLESLGYFDTSFEYAADYDLFLRARKLSTYSRITAVLSAQHRHGSNLSMQPTTRHREEVERINREYGPTTQWQRTAYSTALRVLLNGLAPSWYLCKRIDSARERRAVRQSQ